MNRSMGLFRNFIWLLICLILAVFIWVLASFQRDPIVQRSYIQVPIELRHSEDILIVNEPRKTATVLVRAPESTFVRFTRDDIILFVELFDWDIGEHAVEIQAEIQGGLPAAFTDISPSQVTVHLEKEVAREIAVQVQVLGDIPPGYFLGEMQPSPAVAQIIGPAQEIEQVTSLRANVPLLGQQLSFSEEVELIATKDNGQRIANLRIIPERVEVSVEITARDDIQQVAVQQPPLDFSSLPWGYYPSSIQYEPQFIFASGTPTQLATLPEFLTTAQVDLSDRSEDFEIEVPINIPENLIIIDNQRSVTVQIGIAAQEGYRQFDSIAVQLLGIAEGVETSLLPENITLYLAGPLPILRDLNVDQIQAYIDARGLSLGAHSIPPTIDLPFDDMDVTSYSVIPSLLELELRTPDDE